MKKNSLVAMAALALPILIVGCATTERSRNLNNPAVAGKTIAQQVCASCHGVDGNSTSPNFPKLAAQQEPYFIAQLSGFRNHNRADPAGFEYMWGLSRNLTDTQIKDLAAYFAQQKPKPIPVDNPALVERGEKIFKNGLPDKEIPACASCHGTNGEGNMIFPRLASQHADYLTKQLLVFQRTNDRPEGAIMKQVAHSLGTDDIAAVTTYLQSR